MAEGGKYPSVIVAKYIVAKANGEKLDINITKTQKLLYIAYGIYLAVKKERLTDESPQAWPYGPVFPATRKALLSYASLSEITLGDESLSGIKADEEMESLMALVFGEFGKWSATRLSEWSHQEGSPWDKTVCDCDFSWGDIIPDGFIAPFFKNMIVPQKP